jgi:hypothetical protein
MGIKKGKIRIHLWFWLSRKVIDSEMKAWLDCTPVDLRLFYPVQMHYIARPLFSEGVVDPVPQRSGKHDAGTDRDTVRVPDDLKTRTQATLSKPRHVRQDGVVESQDIIRDPSTGLVINGRERLLFDLSDQAKAELGSMNVVDQKIANLQQEVAIMQTARNAYARALGAALPKDS